MFNRIRNLPRPVGRALKGVIAIAAVLGLSGCYTIGMIGASGYHPPVQVPQSIKGPTARYAATSAAQKQTPLLVVVRFPAKIDPKADATFKRVVTDKYLNGPKGSDVGKLFHNTNQDPHRQTIVKSTYYATEFFEQLRQRLPEGSVVLHPAVATLDSKGYLKLETQNALPPAVLYIDFFAYYTYEHASFGLAETFGKRVTPVLSMHTAPSCSPKTFGAIAGTEYTDLTIGGADPKGKLGSGLRGNLLTFFNTWMESEGIVATPYHGSADTGNRPDTISAGAYKKGTYFQVPLVELEMNFINMVALSGVKGGNLKNPPSRNILSPYANIAVQALNTLDVNKCTEIDRMAYAASFDPELGSTNPGAMSAAQKRRLAILAQFAEKERALLNLIDNKFIDLSYRGDHGDTIRRLLVAEENKYMKVKAAVDRYMQAVFTSAMMAMGGYLDMTYLGVLENEQKFSRDLAREYNSHLGQVFEGTFEFTVEIEGEKVTVQTNGLSDMREKLRRLYRRKVLHLTS